MTVFISYSRLDEAVVTSLIADIKQCGEQPWLDDQLRGGEEWWNEILHQIRESKIFIFCLSDNSMNSKPCQSELQYARQLGLPVIPIQVGEFSSMRAFPLAEIHIIDYRSRSSSAGLHLANAMRTASSRPFQLPSPLPPTPPLPRGKVTSGLRRHIPI
jgi:serine/threonine kinase PknH